MSVFKVGAIANSSFRNCRTLADMMSSTLQSAVIGGVLIGLAATWLYLSIGRIAGISGIAARALSGASWPLLFVIGLGLGGWIATALVGPPSGAASAIPTTAQDIRWLWLISGGLLVGFGTRLGSGCTSGHGVCGIARVSPRSIAATCVFLGTGMLVATLLAGFSS